MFVTARERVLWRKTVAFKVYLEFCKIHNKGNKSILDVTNTRTYKRTYTRMRTCTYMHTQTKYFGYVLILIYFFLKKTMLKRDWTSHIYRIPSQWSAFTAKCWMSENGQRRRGRSWKIWRDELIRSCGGQVERPLPSSGTQ